MSKTLVKKISTLSLATIKSRILIIRDEKVMLDEDLAGLYGVKVKALNQAVKRNKSRFPDDFMFRLEKAEFEALRSQSVTIEKGKGRHRKYLPYVFTEEGVAMLSGVLSSQKAVLVNIAIMRAFVRMREVAASYKILSRKLEELEKKDRIQSKKIKEIFTVLNYLIKGKENEKKEEIGFKIS